MNSYTENLLGTELMNLFNRITVGSVTTERQINSILADMCDTYGTEAVGSKYVEMKKGLSPFAQILISKIDGSDKA